MLDKERILSKVAELDSYLAELKSVKPADYEDYMEAAEKKRACERLLQIAVESAIDICSLLVKGLELGIPSSEEDIFEKLEKKKIITREMKEKLKSMKGFRNVLVHHYADIDDELVFENLKNINDFKEFREQITRFLKSNKMK